MQRFLNARNRLYAIARLLQPPVVPCGRHLHNLWLMLERPCRARASSSCTAGDNARVAPNKRVPGGLARKDRLYGSVLCLIYLSIWLTASLFVIIGVQGGINPVCSTQIGALPAS